MEGALLHPIPLLDRIHLRGDFEELAPEAFERVHDLVHTLWTLGRGGGAVIVVEVILEEAVACTDQ